MLGKNLIVPESCSVLKYQHHQITSAHELLRIIKIVDEASAHCAQVHNPEEQYAVLCRQRIGRGEHICIETSPIIDQGMLYESTVRKNDCELLIVAGQYPTPQRCTTCRSFRGTLRAALSRQKQSIDHGIDHTSITIHTSFASLNPEDKDTRRLRNLQQRVLVKRAYRGVAPRFGRPLSAPPPFFYSYS